jgi:hypothetical protein
MTPSLLYLPSLALAFRMAALSQVKIEDLFSSDPETAPPQSASPCRSAITTAWVRSATPSFANSALT